MDQETRGAGMMGPNIDLMYLPNTTCTLTTTMRELVSYDDITQPFDAGEQASAAPSAPPTKKQKKNHKGAKQQQASIKRDDAANSYDIEMTNNDAWDDSALIDAWNAATEEYEVRYSDQVQSPITNESVGLQWTWQRLEKRANP